MSFGSWLRKATTLPTKGALGGIGKALRPIVGENILDEVGTVGGFLVGGPGGAAAGRALGNGAHTQNLGKTLRAGAEGYAMGTGANMLGVPGGNMAGLKLPGISQAFSRAPVPTVPGAAPVAPKAIGGRALDGISKFLSGNDGLNALATAQMATSVLGGRQQGKVADQQYAADRDDMMYRRERQGRLDAQREKLMAQIAAAMAARRAG